MERFLKTLSEKSKKSFCEDRKVMWLVQVRQKHSTKLATDLLSYNKNALTASFRLACLEIRSRNEEAINSTRSRIYSIKVVYFQLYPRGVFLRIFTGYTRKCKGLDSREITSLPEIKKVIYMAPHKTVCIQ